MKKNKIAFTLIELLVVTTIMILLSSGSVLYFFEFSDNREISIYGDILETKLEDLNKQIKAFKISDYEIYFTSEQAYYIGMTNTLGIENIMTLSIDSDTLIGTFQIVGGGSDKAWNYSIYREGKETLNKISTADSVQNFPFISGSSYEILAYLDGKTINTIFIDYIAPADSGIILVEGTGKISNKNNIISTQPTGLELVLEKSGQQQTITLN